MFFQVAYWVNFTGISLSRGKDSFRSILQAHSSDYKVFSFMQISFYLKMARKYFGHAFSRQTLRKRPATISFEKSERLVSSFESLFNISSIKRVLAVFLAVIFPCSFHFDLFPQIKIDPSDVLFLSISLNKRLQEVATLREILL